MQRILIWTALALLALTAAVMLASRRLGERDPADLLADSLQVLRATAEACRDDLDDDAAELDTFDASLDSMRARVRAFEALHPRGVPADSYDAYLAAFDSYNDSVAGFGTRADTLRIRLGRCRALTERHNVLVDSLRALLARRAAESR